MKRRFIVEIEDDNISDIEGFRFVQHVLQISEKSVHPDGREKYCTHTVWKSHSGYNIHLFSPSQYKSNTEKFIVYTDKQKEN